jgi:hypothetical protein
LKKVQWGQFYTFCDIWLAEAYFWWMRTFHTSTHECLNLYTLLAISMYFIFWFYEELFYSSEYEHIINTLMITKVCFCKPDVTEGIKLSSLYLFQDFLLHRLKTTRDNYIYINGKVCTLFIYVRFYFYLLSEWSWYKYFCS